MIKTGKTTFILDIVRQLLTGDPWCELPTKKSAVIYLTEQSPMSFNTELQLAGIKGGAMKVLYHLEATRFGWLSIAQKVVEWGQRFEAGLVVVDTLPRWADLAGEGENQAGSAKIISALEPVLATGCSLALVFHSGKDGDNRSIENAIRGSSAWGGAVDQIYRLRRPQGNQRDNCRVLESSGRYNHVIAEKLGLRFVDDRYEITSRKEVEKVASGAINRILDALPRNPENADTLSELLEKSEVGRGTVQRAIKNRKDVQTVGEGTKLSPFRYFRPADSAHANILPIGDSIESPEFGQERMCSPLGPPSISVSVGNQTYLSLGVEAPGAKEDGILSKTAKNVGQHDEWEFFEEDEGCESPNC